MDPLKPLASVPHGDSMAKLQLGAVLPRLAAGLDEAARVVAHVRDGNAGELLTQRVLALHVDAVEVVRAMGAQRDRAVSQDRDVVGEAHPHPFHSSASRSYSAMSDGLPSLSTSDLRSTP